MDLTLGKLREKKGKRELGGVIRERLGPVPPHHGPKGFGWGWGWPKWEGRRGLGVPKGTEGSRVGPGVEVRGGAGTRKGIGAKRVILIQTCSSSWEIKTPFLQLGWAPGGLGHLQLTASGVRRDNRVGVPRGVRDPLDPSPRSCGHPKCSVLGQELGGEPRGASCGVRGQGERCGAGVGLAKSWRWFGGVGLAPKWGLALCYGIPWGALIL